jgi:hypothetical protein
MIPVPPPLIFELGTAAMARPLKVTLVMLASAVVASSAATPTTSARSAAPPMVCDHERELRPVVVVAARLEASKVMAAKAGAAAIRLQAQAKRPRPRRKERR